MKTNLVTSSLIICFVGLLIQFSACKKPKKTNTPSPPEAEVVINTSPLWKADSPCFLDGPPGSFDDLAVKDPTIVYSGGKHHLFYTAREKGPGGTWRMAYASASQISELDTAPRTFMTALVGGSYFCAPQVFQFSARGTWYLIYQSGQGATFSTSSDVADPDSWTPGKGMGFSDGIDFWCLSDGNYVYCFYSAQDGTRTIKRRRTTIANFPYNWEAPTVVATSTFEAPHVYKNKADGKFYMVVEDIARHQELWVATTLGGTWTKLSEKWASIENLSFLSERWTDQVSHVELLRSGINERLEVNDINRCEMLIQGVVNGNYGDYGNIPYDLGLMRNY
ncbi:non-reducing end alpha-L-arabinofuranosidase family hydrolase [Paradesertivirga mongoliensis]|uniref:non-reducing end alpha-L-arabinofuranosidase n=1 Tax=Paradesertivirga mongoliensis TaxID=2100740 RepID=A0ABW4ZMB4_9SPHI|nr:non-reducing end alpha-L-arabinofuranosidase family hydrolase [Pedobacter mongoliensis]